jgi:TRAP-type C4-dicarboxylate transport system substrate-binding protein
MRLQNMQTNGGIIMKNWKMKCLILCVAAIGICCLSPAVFGQGKPIILNYTTHMPPQHTLSVLDNLWAKEVEKRTNGRVKVTIFYSGTLLAADKSYEGVKKGVADVGLTVPSFTKGRFPLIEVIDLPLGYDKALSASKMVDDFYKKFKPAEFDDVQVMHIHAHGPGVIHSKKAINRLEDFRGMKIRCTGTSANVARALGATPVAMSVADAYDALSRGVVDASMAPMETGQSMKWGEVTKYIVEVPSAGYSIAFATVMNKGVWKSLPRDIQAIIEEINKEWPEKRGKGWDAADIAGKKFALGKGNKIITFSKEEDERVAKVVRPLLDDYVQSMKKKGLPGDEALKFCVDDLNGIKKSSK